MSAQPSVDDSFTFVGGLNTEGGYFVTPKNTWKEGQNIVPKKDGSIERRPAVVFETGYEALGDAVVDPFNSAYTVERWTNVGSQKDVDWFVVQKGRYILFYEAYTGTVSARTAIEGFVYPEGFVGPVPPLATLTIDLEDYRCEHNTNVIASSIISVASVYGNLIITHPDCNPILVEWRENQQFAITGMSLKIRDFKGIHTNVPLTTEYTEAEWTGLGFWPHALYNLYNQGWYDTQIAAYKTANTNKLPANTKQWVYGKDTNDDFDATVLAKVDFGSSSAPKGRFILDAFNEDRALALAQVPDTDTTIGSAVGSPGEQDGYRQMFEA